VGGNGGCRWNTKTSVNKSSAPRQPRGTAVALQPWGRTRAWSAAGSPWCSDGERCWEPDGDQHHHQLHLRPEPVSHTPNPTRSSPPLPPSPSPPSPPLPGPLAALPGPLSATSSAWHLLGLFCPVPSHSGPQGMCLVVPFIPLQGSWFLCPCYCRLRAAPRVDGEGPRGRVQPRPPLPHG